MYYKKIENIAIIGASGSIGMSFINNLDQRKEVKSIFAFSRMRKKFFSKKIISKELIFTEEKNIEEAAEFASKKNPLDLVIVATGMLYGKNFMPEKSLKELSENNFRELFFVNTIGPALVAKHFLPKLNKTQKSIFAVLSARVGSISDNILGGWYSYRTSKAALNMVVKNLSIELSRINKEGIIIALHPGTVDSNLSKPFQKFVKKEKLFTPEYSVENLLKVVYSLQSKDSGKIFAWDGKEILP